MQGQTLKPFSDVPNTDVVKTNLTPGEFVIRKEAVDVIGEDALNLLNNLGENKPNKLGQLSALMEYRPSGFQKGGEVMLKTKKENLPNAGLKALFDSGAQGKEALGNMGFQKGGQVMNYADGGKVMNYYGGGKVIDMVNRNMMGQSMMGGGLVENDALGVFGEKSADADELNALMTLRAMRMQQGGMVPGMMPPQMPSQSLPPAGMMMQEGGMVDQQMPQGEPMGMDMQPMPTGERAFPASSPMEQLNLKPNEMMAYEQYGPDTFRHMAPKFKPQSEHTAYDAMVNSGVIDPYETSEDDFVVMTRDMANSLRGMNGV